MSDQKWDVIVIGGSFSGLSAGALLANAGKKVLILEKEGHLGGRMSTAEYRGHVIDNGAHGFMMNGYTEEIFARLGKPFPGFLTWSKSNIYYNGKWQDWGELFPPGELRRIIKEEIIPRSYEELEEYDDIPLEEWVSKRTNDTMTHLFFWPMGWLLGMGSEYGPVSAGNVLILMKEQLEKRGNFANVGGEIPGGFGTLIRALADAAKEKGVEVRTNAKVSDVIFEEGKVRGVEVDTGERILPAHFIDTEFIEAPVVVSSVPIWHLFNIVSEDEFPSWYVDWIKDISKRYVNIYSIYYGMERVPIGDDSTFWWVSELPRTGLPGALAWYRTYSNPRASTWLVFGFRPIGLMRALDIICSKSMNPKSGERCERSSTSLRKTSRSFSLTW